MNITAKILGPEDAGDDGKITYRAVPFRTLGTGEQMYTLVKEWRMADGSFVCERREQMSAEQFSSLRDAVLEAQ